MSAAVYIAAGLWAGLWSWPLRIALERDMAVHMIVQLPLLILVGWLLGLALREHEPVSIADADWLGIPGILLVLFATSFWMLPRALDGAVADPWMDFAKFVTLPLLAGVPLAVSWRRMPGLGRAFIWANFIPKLGAIGGLYLAAPARLCAYYRIDQQAATGWTLIGIAIALAMAWFIAALIGWPRPAVRWSSKCTSPFTPTSRFVS
jgi:hypothetical protein